MEHFIYFKRLCLMLICCLSVSLPSWADDYTKDGIIYSLNEASGTATVKAVTDKSATSAKIRTRVAGCNVIKIGTNAFKDCTALKAVTIPTSVTNIDDSAFEGCSTLTGVSDLSSVTNIGASAFEGCSALTGVSDLSSVTNIGASAFEGCSALTGVSNLSSVTNIGASAFKDCSSLKVIDISSINSSEGLGASAFEGCSSLTDINMPSAYWYDLYARTFYGCTSLTAIDTKDAWRIYDEAFAGCSSLQSIDISRYTSIVSSAFNGCNAIEAFNIPSDNSYYTSEGSVIFNKSKTELVCAVGKLGNYAIPSTVTSIDNNAFKDCIYLTGVSIPYGVTNIESNTFKNCTALTSVTIPSTVKTISSEAFKGCSALPSVVIPSSVTSIHTSTFEGNTSLKSVLLKSKAIDIIDNVFPETTKIICMPENEDNTKADAFNLKIYKDPWGADYTPSAFLTKIGGIWYFPKETTNISAYNTYNNTELTSYFNYNRINSDITDILSTNDAAKTFIANRKTIYDRLSNSLRTPLESVLNETSNVDDFFNLEDAELSALKAKLNTAYNNVRYAVYDQLDLNDDLYDLYLQGKEVADKINVATANVSQENIDKIANTPYGYHDGLITDASQLSTDAELYEGTLENLIDANTNSYIHTPLDIDALPFLQIDLINAYQNIILKYSYNKTYDWDVNGPYGFHIYASNFNDEANWTDLGTVNCTYNYENGKTGITALNLGKKYRYIRLTLMGGVGDSQKLIWNEFHAYEANFNNVVPSKFYEDFNLTLEQAKNEIDNEYATEETIETLQELINKFNDAPFMDFAKSEYLTLYSDKALIVPEELSAAVVLSDGDNVRSDYRYKAGDVITANTGVLLKSGKGNSFYMIEGETDETTPEDNLLHGTLNDEMTDVEGAGKYYKLAYDRDTKSIIGFYWGATDGAAFLNKAGKAFLALPATMNAQQLKGFALSDLDNGRGNISDINNVTNAPANNFRAFDLNGRRVDAKSIDELQQGVYIVNGKKIIK